MASYRIAIRKPDRTGPMLTRGSEPLFYAMGDGPANEVLADFTRAIPTARRVWAEHAGEDMTFEAGMVFGVRGRRRTYIAHTIDELVEVLQRADGAERRGVPLAEPNET